MYSIPNIISFLRVAIAPVFYILMIKNNPGSTRIACGLFVAGAITDYLDGWLARNVYGVTSVGKFVDPLADKVFTTAAFLSFVHLGIVELWMVIIIIVRDFGTTILRLFAVNNKHTIRTSRSAQWKTFLQMVFIVYILILLLMRDIHFIKITPQKINELIYSDFSYYIMLFLTIITLWTAIEYMIYNRSLFKIRKAGHDSQE
ncbi:MAG: CDP-diacylglycerol--glycerol-3-phosphate 3-phosphatidyltransferase [Ignavibacteria bacterium GWB2_35_12]|nr:MAG: CDP-diacylglycerol--glycerol-3-phosphate 3-phosphatidyltransferase [Ignavibacteria bacterium GWA2_35_8]OGU41646.1 MAG: CDP-diacylglycerol--glycerol-3-phosphate 3-phosphatidyltransferase [Ignavibacteria bacterium GWB2_35_12]OGU91385.1 MAG: CDP-diacylglycerol--glycerol-3-phosphate 3-phosphatidyltransferase [Ignavibacteria bacterium RIFOXYA2_FULL_35_10]OGV24982.1 MAG: CDP-diacylglycerol--glycerol-3-phosphate 3-phosphatidyltransferase [Ignavibacteria bacterium RIFOXYC2_FULL_35_21]